MAGLALLTWASSLPVTWTYYVTLTFRRATTSMNAVMKLRSWLSSFMTPTPVGPRRWSVKRILYSVEPHKTGNAHIHALLVTSRSPYAGHCKRCSHSPGSCDRVSIRVVNPKTGVLEKKTLYHGSKVTDPEWKQLNESWACHFGWARFEPYNPELRFGALQYVLKYVLSENMLDWGFMDDML